MVPMGSNHWILPSDPTIGFHYWILLIPSRLPADSQPTPSQLTANSQPTPSKHPANTQPNPSRLPATSKLTD